MSLFITMASTGSQSSHRGVGSFDQSAGPSRSIGDRHGIAERSGRERDRPRARSTPPGQPQFVRFNAVGPEETMDWLAALESVINRLDTAERLVRLHAETLANHDTELQSMRTGCRALAKDVDEYKQYNQKRFTNMEGVIEKEFQALKPIVTELDAVHFPQLSANVQTTSAMLESLVEVVTKLRGPQSYDVATPIQAPRQELPSPAPPVQPPGLAGDHNRQPAPPVPNSFGAGLVDHRGLLQDSPPAERQGRYQPHGAAQSPFGDAQIEGRAQIKDFDISYKHNPQIKVFDGSISQYKHWAERMKDHIARNNHRWAQMLEFVADCKTPVTKEDLWATHCDGVNAWTLALKLNSFLADWLSADLYGRRIQLAGGVSQKGNGFELWRQLFVQFAGGTTAVKHGGQMRLKDFPKCRDIHKLEAHLDAWTNCLEEFGSELYAAPGMLTTMAIDLLPEDLENEVIDIPELNTHTKVIAWVKRRLEYKRQKKMADFARKDGGRINAITGIDDNDHQPDMAVPPPPQPHEAPRPEKNLMKAVNQLTQLVAALNGGGAQRGRGAKPTGARSPRSQSPKTKFFWDPEDCWHCKGKHRREDCKEWITIMKKHNGNIPRSQWKPPPGYQSAKAKAYAKWKESNPARVNHLGAETDDDDSDSDESAFQIKCCALRKMDSDGFMKPRLSAKPRMVSEMERMDEPLTNSFSALMEHGEDDLDEVEQTVRDLKSWAHKVKVGKTKNTISGVKDLDRFMAKNPNTAKLPEEPKHLQKIMKVVSSKVKCAHDEVLVLMDSGATGNTADIAAHFPDYEFFVMPSLGSSVGETATTACGAELRNRGKCTVHGRADGQEIAVPFQDMAVTLPIISVRKCVKSGKDIIFFEHGGEMRDRKTGKVIKIHEIGGTYYIKMKVHRPPDDQPKPEIPVAPF